MLPPAPGDPIEIRTGTGTKAHPYKWLPAIAGRHTPTRLFYRWPDDPTQRGPCTLACEGSTWRHTAPKEPIPSQPKPPMYLLDFRIHNRRYYFQIKPGDGFWPAQRLFKKTFATRQRTFHGSTGEWSVPINTRNETKLRGIFTNFEICLAYAKAQLKLAL